MAANDRREGDFDSRGKPTANGTPPSVEMVCLERGPSYYDNDALSIYEDVSPMKRSTNEPSWILQRTLNENPYETITPSLEVGATTTSTKQPEVDKKGDRSCLSSAGRLRQKVGRFRSEHQAEIRYFIYAIFVVAYCVYFTFAMQHEFGSEASVRLLCMTLLGVFLCLVSLLRSCAPGIRTPQTILKFGHFLRRHQRILMVCFCVLIAAGLVTFLVVDVALKRPSNLISLLGIFIFVFLTFIFSANPGKVRWRAVLWGLGLQFVFGLVVLRTPWGYAAFRWLGDRVQEFIGHTDAGAKFVFGEKFVDHPFAMKVLPVIIFFSCSISVLYHLGVMQAIITRLAWLMQCTMGTTAAESTNAAGNIFIGQTEAPLLIRPLIQGMTRSELHAVMVAGFASIAGAVLATYILLGVPANHLITASVMAAPCALALSKLSYPETGESKTSEQNIARLEESPHKSVIEAASAGASASVKIVANIAVNLIAFIAMLHFVNATLTWFGHRVGLVAPHRPELTFQMICSYVLWPFAFIMGVSSDDCRKMAELVGVKIFINEFVAYNELSVLIANSHTFRDYNGTWTRLNDDIHLHDSNTTLVGGVLHERTVVIATYALCGFANISSIGLVLGVLGSMAQDRKSDIADLVVRAMIIGNVVCFMNACTAGLLHQGTT